MSWHRHRHWTCSPWEPTPRELFKCGNFVGFWPKNSFQLKTSICWSIKSNKFISDGAQAEGASRTRSSWRLLCLVPPSGSSDNKGDRHRDFGQVHQEEGLSSPFYSSLVQAGLWRPGSSCWKGWCMFLPSGFFREIITWLLQLENAKTTCISPRDCGVRDPSAADTPTHPWVNSLPANSSSLELGHLPV